MKKQTISTSSFTAEQGTLISLHLETPVTCPACRHTFPLRAGLGEATITRIQEQQAANLAEQEAVWEARFQEKCAALDNQWKAKLAQLSQDRTALEAERARLERERDRALAEVAAEAEKERAALLKAQETKLREVREAALRSGRETALAEQEEELLRLRADATARTKLMEKLEAQQRRSELARVEAEQRLERQEHEASLALRQAERKLRKEIAQEVADTHREMLREAIDSERAEADRKLKAAELAKAKALAKVEQLRKQMQQPPQQLQGETAEAVFEDAIALKFPSDDFLRIRRGQKGADLLQTVMEQGEIVGKILWEVKDCASWSAKWLPKLQKDMEKAKVRVGVIVTPVLPPGVKDKVTHMDGCWICAVDAWGELVKLLRPSLIELHQLRASLEDQEGKASQIYRYLQSERFQQAVATMATTLRRLHDQVVTEKSALAKQWSAREQMIEHMSQLHHEQWGILQNISQKPFAPDGWFNQDEDSAA